MNGRDSLNKIWSARDSPQVASQHHPGDRMVMNRLIIRSCSGADAPVPDSSGLETYSKYLGLGQQANVDRQRARHSFRSLCSQSVCETISSCLRPKLRVLSQRCPCFNQVSFRPFRICFAFISKLLRTACERVIECLTISLTQNPPPLHSGVGETILEHQDRSTRERTATAHVRGPASVLLSFTYPPLSDVKSKIVAAHFPCSRRSKSHSLYIKKHGTTLPSPQ